MSALYVETSALVAWLLGEPAAEGVRDAIASTGTIVTSSLTRLEAQRALLRAVSTGVVREAEAQRLRGILSHQYASWIVMEVGAAVLDRAGRAFPVEPVRSLDAIHLASALAFAEALPDLRMLARDRRIMDNATALGLA